jgi:L-lactate dehydrogenase complex protein LldG
VSARGAILSRLGGAATLGAIDSEAAALLIAPERPRVDPARLEGHFLTMLTLPSIAATVDRIASLNELPRAVATYLAAHDLPSVLCVPPDPRVAAGDWPGITLHEQAAPDESAVLAFARCGVAETGSLVFETSSIAPMLPNFLALHHIVVVPLIVAQLEDAMLGGSQPRAHYCVTGVSGTTDIEGTYVRGAHGPRFLHVLMLSR